MLFMKNLEFILVVKQYKLKQKKLLWATGGLLLFLLFVIRYVMILIDSSRLLIKGLAE